MFSICVICDICGHKKRLGGEASAMLAPSAVEEGKRKKSDA
jgi:hypothetical protein